MAERYVRPPLVGPEPRSQLLAVWRFRLLLLALVVVLAIAVIVVIQAAGAGTEQSPGLTGALASRG